MPSQMGRPPSDNPKNTMIRVRMDDETIQLMDGCAMTLGTTRSDIIRTGIKKLAEDIMNGYRPEEAENDKKE